MSYTNLLYHLVYATKDRAPLITKNWRDDLHAYLGGAVRKLDGIALEVGGVADHVHLLAKIPPTTSVSDFMSKLKAGSSSWSKQRSARPFSWQNHYAAFSVSESQVDGVRDYIRRQEEHHRASSFEEEFKALLRKHNIAFEERYLWSK